METWLSYDLSDLLMFSPRVYYRQLELANAAAWPLHLVTTAVLAAAFASSCLLYVLPAFAEIHVAGWYMAALFLGQAAALAGLVLLAGGLTIQPGGRLLTWCRTGLVVLITLAYPALAMMSGRSIASAEVFGIAADPTALAALIVIAMGARGWQLLLAIPPWLWLAFSASSLWAMDAPEVWIILPVLMLAPAILLAVWGRSRK
jgi:hypothetical protein